MNNLTQLRSTSATLVLVGFSAAMAGEVANKLEVIQKPAYEILKDSTSYSKTANSVQLIQRLEVNSFEQKIKSVYEELSHGQETLGSKFESIWDENLDALYES